VTVETKISTGMPEENGISSLFLMPDKQRSCLEACMSRLSSAWRGEASYPATKSGSFGFSVLVNFPSGSCYIRQARTTRLLKPERRFNEQTAVSKWLSVSREAKSWT
jgi:hypothetical protein